MRAMSLDGNYSNLHHDSRSILIDYMYLSKADDEGSYSGDHQEYGQYNP